MHRHISVPRALVIDHIDRFGPLLDMIVVLVPDAGDFDSDQLAPLIAGARNLIAGGARELALTADGSPVLTIALED